MVISNRADSCRQLLRRARQHLADARARFEVSPEQLQKLAQVEDELLKKIGALRNVLSGEPDDEEPENSKPVEAILPDDEKMKVEKQISELESQLTKVRSELQLLEAKKSGESPAAPALEAPPATPPAAPAATDK